MSNKLLNILNFEVGDDVWWFKVSSNQDSFFYSYGLLPGHIELVHDTVKEIKDGNLHCWHSVHTPSSIWGKSRKEAWDRLKADLERWGRIE